MDGSNPRNSDGIDTAAVVADDDGITAACDIIAAGGCVAVPTETVYGLAADATNADGVASIFTAKGRPSFNPLIVHVADIDMARQWVEFGPLAETLATQFWPGALTIVLPRRDNAAGRSIADAVTAGLPTLAVRCPAHPVMRALIHAVGQPLAAPSANRSGTVSPTCAAHVISSLGGRIPMVIDGGQCAQGIESTIVAPGADAITMLRPGQITAEQLHAATGMPVIAHDGHAIIAPGQMTRHYAPGKPVLLDQPVPPDDAFVIGFGDCAACDINLSAVGDLAEAARNLFAALHLAAGSAKPRIAIAPIPRHGVGIAINDRLARAAA